MTDKKIKEQTANHHETVERLRKAAGLGIKISTIYKAANLSPFRIKCIVSDADYGSGKPLTESEAEAINAALDGIKSEL